MVIWSGWITGCVMLIIIFVIVWLAYKETQKMPTPKPVNINKLNSRQLRKRFG